MQELGACAAGLFNERDLKTDLKGEAESIRQSYGDLYKAFAAGLQQLQNDLKAKRGELSSAEAEWSIKFKGARTARDSVLEKLGAHKTATS